MGLKWGVQWGLEVRRGYSWDKRFCMDLCVNLERNRANVYGVGGRMGFKS